MKHLFSIALVFVREFGASRMFALVALLLWCIALFTRVIVVPVTGFLYRILEQFDGWVLALFGWLGPLSLAPGWYANIPFAMSVIRCLRGRPAGRRPALIGLVLAATALMPMPDRFGMYDVGAVESGDPDWYVLRGLAVLLWLSACALAWILAIWRPDDQVPNEMQLD